MTVDRVYHVLSGREDAEEGEQQGEKTNPGEWPWAVLIYKGDEYVGAGVLVGPDTVVTAAHKVQKTLDNGEADSLTVRIGDFDTTTTIETRGTLEEFQHIDRKVNCIKLHPRTKVPFEFNVAVIKLEKVQETGPLVRDPVNAANVISLFAAVNNDVDVEYNTEKEEEFKARRRDSPAQRLSLRAGLLADLNECYNALGDDIGDCNESEIETEPEIEKFRPRVYSNTACLPESPSQFPAGKRCWLAAWGRGGQEQREVGGRFVHKQTM
jgi:hypothetical protein